jgi:tetratricopeptide (TPR) repeat protein
VGLTLIVLALAACDLAGGFGASETVENRPPGIDTSQDAVDGLIVGHRLMEAGQYELALDAYLRSAADRGFDVDVLSAIGSANLKLGRLGQAETQLRRAIKTDETFAPAWNNLGVVLMEQRKFGEASRVFRTAFALDSGESVDIRNNLRLALANLENPTYSDDQEPNFALVRRGSDEFLLLPTP